MSRDNSSSSSSTVHTVIYHITEQQTITKEDATDKMQQKLGYKTISKINPSSYGNSNQLQHCIR